MASFNRTRWLDEGPKGPMAPVVATDCYHCSKKKKNLTTLLDSCVSSLLGHASLFCIVQKTPRNVLVILARAVLIFSASSKKTRREKTETCVSPCAEAMLISVSFKSDYTSRFLRGRRASILILDGIRNRRAECHLESRVIATNHSHTFPFSKEFPSTPASSHMASKTISNNVSCPSTFTTSSAMCLLSDSSTGTRALFSSVRGRGGGSDT